MATIPLGRYLWERIHQVGVNTIFGVPGDFNIQFLDYIYNVQGLKWVGNQNELNAAYAADGYARVKNAPGVLVTTHGVGELSALNGIAGALSEHVKMIHVVGQTPKPMQESHMMIHHSIGDKPDHQVYNKTSKFLRVAEAELWDLKTAPDEIDRVVRECFIQSCPVYIFLPLDLSMEQVPSGLLDTKIDLSLPVDSNAQQSAVESIIEALSKAQSPSILIDAFVHRHDAVEEARKLVDKLQIPIYTSNCGKSIIDETHSNYVGVYNGQISSPGIAAACETSDLVLILGCMPSDTNSGGFSRNLAPEKCIHVNPRDVLIKGKTYLNTFMKPLLTGLTVALPNTPLHKLKVPKLPPPFQYKDSSATHITQSWVWGQFGKFFKPGDVIVGETGTTCFGLCDTTFPANIRFVNQIYYCSIGYATAATLGAEVARLEVQSAKSQPSGRTILITGDGSMAMTIQEIGTMVKQGIKPIIFVINNNGYTIERLIWGARQPYNDIVPTDYSALLPLFRHPNPKSSFHKASTKVEFEDVLKQPELQEPKDLQIIEVVMQMKDTPWRLGAQIAFRGDSAKKYLREEGFVDSIGGWGLE
ncbi:pyruvate decarboxylase-like protein [Lepidopterella palustris CBS 459.81]|uniref:Pyruvate decarboxylase n=1 Tax=Lepidopterella palustris CBS 459.81 TaxID=1314670 RepID=A0A8E2JJC7_9PEZI|nr:pyruvate decarboxylase-like protein [Lepidopterella palustris CBS 459.81]